MIDTIAYAVAASQIAVLYWLCARTFFALADQNTFARNPAWCAAHPDFRARHAHAARASGASYALGAIWLAVLLASGPAASAGWLAFLSTAPTLCWILLLGAYKLYQARRVAPLIPLPERRRASLQRRTLRDFVPPAVSLPCFALYAAAYAIYGAAYWLALLPVATIGARLTGVTVILLIAMPVLLYALRRKDNAADRAAGPRSRIWEVRFHFVVLYGGLAVIALRVAEDFFRIDLLNTMLFFTFINLLLQAIFLTALLSPMTKRFLAGEHHA